MDDGIVRPKPRLHAAAMSCWVSDEGDLLAARRARLLLLAAPCNITVEKSRWGDLSHPRGEAVRSALVGFSSEGGADRKQCHDAAAQGIGF